MRRHFAFLFLFHEGLILSIGVGRAATWPPGGASPSPISATMHLPGDRYVPSTKRWNLIWADQIIPGNITPSRLQFASEHYSATQKIWDYQAAQFRAHNPNFLVTMYHLAAGLNPEHNDDCPQPTSNMGSGFIGVIAPAGYVNEYPLYFRPWLAQQGIAEPSARFESMFQHYDSIDSFHRVWHNDPAWLMNLANDDWRTYLSDICIDWMTGNQNDGCFFDVAVETNSSLYNPKLSDPSPVNFDWWFPPHGPAGEGSQTPTRAAFAAWQNKKFRECFQNIYRRLHSATADYLVIPNTDQMVTTVYDPVWTDGDASGETIDGAMMEGFGYYRSQDMWLTLDRCVRHITGRGKILIAQFGASSSAERLRRTAMYMLVKNENSFLNILNGDGVEWYPEYEIDLGDQHPLPHTLDSMRVAGQSWQSVWKREYERGMVLVNTSDQTLSVSLPTGDRWARLITGGGGRVTEDGVPLPQSIDTVDLDGTVLVSPSDGAILLRRDAPTRVNAPLQLISPMVRVAPNPVRGQAELLFSLPRTTRSRIEIVDQLGCRIFSVDAGTVSPGEHRIELPDAGRWAVGMYYVRVFTREGVVSKSFVVLGSR